MRVSSSSSMSTSKLFGEVGREGGKGGFSGEGQGCERGEGVLEFRRAVECCGRELGVGTMWGTDETRFTEESEALRGTLGGADVKKEES
jgi:hypothetical protein